MAGRGVGGEQSAVVGRGGELEAGSRSDPKAALAGTRLWLREDGAFVHRWSLKLSQGSPTSVQRSATHRKSRAPCSLVLPEGVMVAQAVKHRARRRLKEVVRQVVVGSEEAVSKRLVESQRHTEVVVNTAYIERLQATFRARLATLVRRTRAGVHRPCTLEAGMWLVGSCYNFCLAHRSLRRGRGVGDPHPEDGGCKAPRPRRRASAITVGRSKSL